MQHVRDALIAPPALIEVLRELPRAPADLDRRLRDHRVDAERHGLGGVLFDGDRSSVVAIAREMEHAAHVDMLHRIDAVLVDAGLRAVALKGALLAERLYSPPSSRGATDIDLLVDEADLDRAAAALRQVGYELSTDPEEERFRREHHHLHLLHADAIPLELHFHAYRGFGSALEGAALVGRSVPWRDFHAVRLLAPDDELVYLMVHAAAHRFGRLSWLYDIKLLLVRMTDEEIRSAARRAYETGYGHVVSLAASLSIELAGVAPARVAPLIRDDKLRRAIASAIAGEPKQPLLRAATRFVYTTMLCPDVGAATRYAKAASLDRVRRMLASRA